MFIYTWKWKNFQSGKSTLWKASIDGPWYGDSDPTGAGDTEQEAIDDVIKIAKGWAKDFKNLIDKPEIVRGNDQG